MALYDVYHIEERLQQIDPRVVRIDFDEDVARHEIVTVDKMGEEYIAFTVPHGKLDARVERELQRIRPERYNAFEEWKQMEAAKERRDNAWIEDMATDLAENVIDSFRRKPSRSID